MTQNNQTPYANLTPQIILEAVESLGFSCNGSLNPLNSYENRVYQLGLDDKAPVIAKFYRPQRWTSAAILEEHLFSQELAEHEIPVIAPMIINGASLHQYQEFQFALFPRHGGRALELDNDEQLQWMGRFLGRLHRVGSCKPFKRRINLDIETYGKQPYQFLLAEQFIPDYLEANFCATVERVLKHLEQVISMVGPVSHIRLHGDCHAGNILWREEGPHIVDLDDCLMGPAIQDLWMLLSGTHEQMQEQLGKILIGYSEFHDFNPREMYLIESLRTLRMLHYCGWLAKRWVDPAFPINFPWFNTPAYWQNQLNNLNEQIELLEQIDC
ncbi:MAG: serine/threonine protein kinase [Legionella sp.]